MNFFEYLSFMRAIMFLWIGATAFSVSQLYRDAYTIAKKESAIISSLTKILFWISVVSTHLALTAIALVLNPTIHRVIISLMPVTMLPLGILIMRFRKESITKQNEHK